MERVKQAQKISEQTSDFLKKNPAIKEALRVFDISYDQYQKTLEGSHYFYTDTSTSPQKTKFNADPENK